jgi:hypothetical protein
LNLRKATKSLLEAIFFFNKPRSEWKVVMVMNEITSFFVFHQALCFVISTVLYLGFRSKVGAVSVLV